MTENDDDSVIDLINPSDDASEWADISYEVQLDELPDWKHEAAKGTLGCLMVLMVGFGSCVGLILITNAIGK